MFSIFAHLRLQFPAFYQIHLYNWVLPLSFRWLLLVVLICRSQNKQQLAADSNFRSQPITELELMHLSIPAEWGLQIWMRQRISNTSSKCIASPTFCSFFILNERSEPKLSWDFRLTNSLYCKSRDDTSKSLPNHSWTFFKSASHWTLINGSRTSTNFSSAENRFSLSLIIVSMTHSCRIFGSKF